MSRRRMLYTRVTDVRHASGESTAQPRYDLTVYAGMPLFQAK